METPSAGKSTVSSEDALKRRGLPWSIGGEAFNTVFVLWTFSGSVFLLYLGELGMPKGQIGVVLSLFPFLGLLALGFAPVAARWGRKRVFVAGYAARKAVMAGLLLLPLVLAAAGRTWALALLFLVVALFAVLRALAETAFYPWVQEFVPNDIRGRYGAVLSVVTATVACFALVTAGWVLGDGTGLGRFQMLIGVGCFCGLLGVVCYSRVPGGRPLPRSGEEGSHADRMAQCLRDRSFVAYLGGFGALTIGGAFMTSFLPLYMKEKLALADGTIVWLQAVSMIGGVLSSVAGGWTADRVGSRPVLTPALALSLLIPPAWLLLPRDVSHVVLWCGALCLAGGLASGAVGIGVGRLLYNSVVPVERSTSYMAVYYAWQGLAGGVAPLLAGGLLSVCADWSHCYGPWVLDGYAVLFILSIPLLIGSFVFFARVRSDREEGAAGSGQAGA